MFNDAVAARRRARAEGLAYPTAAALSKSLITDAKRTPDRAWLGEVSAVVLQQALADCERAFRNFFASRKGRRQSPRIGPPRFRRRTGTQSVRFARNTRFAMLDSGWLRLPKVGDLKAARSRELPSAPSSVTIIKTPDRDVLRVVRGRGRRGCEQLEPPVDPGAETGIDLGLKDYAVLRNGRVIENPRFFKRLERGLRKAQHALSRKSQGSANCAKALLRVAKVHEKIKHARSDWTDKQALYIIRKNHAVYVEDLNVRGLRRGRAAKSVHDAGFGMFLARLESKAARKGRVFVRVDRLTGKTRGHQGAVQ